MQVNVHSSLATCSESQARHTQTAPIHPAHLEEEQSLSVFVICIPNVACCHERCWAEVTVRVHMINLLCAGPGARHDAPDDGISG